MTEKFKNAAYALDVGVKDDAEKTRLDLIPWDVVDGIARVFTFGARKYKEWNWTGLSKSRLFAAMLRHVFAYWRGEDIDPETGEPHLYHAGCCLMMLASKFHRGLDDRPKREGR